MDSTDGQAPFQASLQINGSHYCGSVIIKPQFLLTAGHCIAGKNVENMEILVGTNKLSSGGTRYKVKKTIKNELYYMPENLDADVTYDIALIHVQTPIQFNSEVQPIKYSTEEINENENLQVFGWGRLKVSRRYLFYLFSLKFLSVFSFNVQFQFTVWWCATR